MFLHALGRGFLFGLQSFWRNIWLSLATVFIIFLALVSVNFLIAVNAVSDSAITLVKERIDVSVYLKPEVKESKVAEVKTHLESLTQVKEVIYRSPEENLETFKERHKSNDKIQETLGALTGNPMGATLIIKAKNLNDYPEILKSLDDPAYADLIEDKSYDDNQIVINRINSIADSVKRAMMFISAIFILIAILIVFNTVRIAIFTHQNEISIMRLVGASNWFIRSPFIFESIMSGLAAIVATIIFIYPVLGGVQSYLNSFFGGADLNLVAYFNDNFLMIFGLQLLGIILLNVVSSLVAISKYLKV
jgi:cell division transport system permease protein